MNGRQGQDGPPPRGPARQRSRRQRWSVVAMIATAIFGAPAAGDNRVESLLRQDGRFATLLADPAAYRLQVLLGQIETTADGGKRLIQEGFRVDAEYFYPASTVKLGAAVVALEALAAWRRETGLAIDADTSLVFHPQFAGEVRVDRDPSNRLGGGVTVGHEIRKLFLVSDNEAYNRLFELVGPDALNRALWRAGLPSARIVHRLSERRTAIENRLLPRIDVVGRSFRHTRSARHDPPLPAAASVPGLEVGIAHLRDGKRIEAPLDFAAKNRFSLRDLQRALCMVVRPDVAVEGGHGFRLDAADRTRLRDAMRTLPGDADNPVYDRTEYPDDWVKFLLPGLRRVLPAQRIAVENKIGRAYGFSIENAYVEDIATGRAFFLAVTLYTNRDGVLNDDQYEYVSVADPFFADLGEAMARTLWGSGQ